MFPRRWRPWGQCAVWRRLVMFPRRWRRHPVYRGAAAFAALHSGAVKLPRGARVIAIVSGGNVDPERALAIMAATVETA